MATPNDDLSLARRGDLTAFGRLIARHERTVYSLALRMLNAPDLAEDMAQEVFISLHANLSVLESNEHLLNWLRRVTSHRCIDQLRRHAPSRFVPLDGQIEAASEDAGDPLLKRRLDALLNELSPAARAVVTLRYQEDLDPAEIATLLDMPVNTVKSHLKRSLEALRQELSEPQILGRTP